MNLDMSLFAKSASAPATESTQEPTAEHQEFDAFLEELGSFAKAYGSAESMQEASVKPGQGVKSPEDGPAGTEVAEEDHEDEDEDDLDVVKAKKKKNMYAEKELYADNKMTKSVMDDEGNEALALDPDEFLKAVNAQVSKTVTHAMTKALAPAKEMNAQNTKGLSLLVKGMQVMGKQSKSLEERVAAMEQQGYQQPAMRKSTVTVHERMATGPTPAANADDAIAEGRALLNKAVDPSLGLVMKGRVSPLEISVGEKYLNLGMPLPADLHQRLKTATA